MATLEIKDWLELGASKDRKIDVQVSFDKDFKNLDYEIFNDRRSLQKINIPLKYPDDTWYNGEVPVYARVKIKNKDFDSGWFTVNVCLDEENTLLLKALSEEKGSNVIAPRDSYR